MATLTDLRDRVRLRLEEASAAVWSDDELDEALTSALELYNERFPLEATAQPEVAQDATSLALPANARSVIRVTLADGVVVPQRGAPGLAGSQSAAGERQAWEAFAGTLWFTRPLPAQTLTLWYLTSHAVGDVPEADVGLLVLGGVWKALEQRSVQELKRAGPVAGNAAGYVVRRAREEFEQAFGQRQRRAKVTLVGRG